MLLAVGGQPLAFLDPFGRGGGGGGGVREEGRVEGDESFLGLVGGWVGGWVGWVEKEVEVVV